ncbi:kinase-like domain-containing protein [Gaertneriomyces semiglobifer]|nr:kinase-like domain-containing protein [Gaertneriomyces semiglobifer]
MATEAVLIKQGAEARVYKTPFGAGRDAIIKERFSKAYRHPVLDEKLTARRVVQEARCLQRLKKAGVDTPTVYLLDVRQSIIYMEFIEGASVRDYIKSNHVLPEDAERRLAHSIGESLALTHDLDIIHGDLTTSNMIIRDGSQSLVLIDFGLSMVSSMVEDKAVDLYVLERAMSSTHPDTERMVLAKRVGWHTANSPSLTSSLQFQSILDAYGEKSKNAKPVLRKLEEVRRRGRKRTAFG